METAISVRTCTALNADEDGAPLLSGRLIAAVGIGVIFLYQNIARNVPSVAFLTVEQRTHKSVKMYSK